MTIFQVNKELIEPTINLMLKYFEFYERELPDKNVLEKHILTLIEDNTKGIQFISIDRSIPSGFATLYFTFSTLSLKPISVMNDLYVEMEFRGTGVADSLFDKCVEFSKSKGIYKMEWVTALDNYRAKKFYNKKGGKGSDWTLYEITF